MDFQQPTTYRYVGGGFGGITAAKHLKDTFAKPCKSKLSSRPRLRFGHVEETEPQKSRVGCTSAGRRQGEIFVLTI